MKHYRKIQYYDHVLRYNTRFSCIQTLKEIDIDRNEIGDNGAKFLAQLLQNNTVVIEKISIAENHIQDDGAQHLALALRNNRVSIIHISSS